MQQQKKGFQQTYLLNQQKSMLLLFAWQNFLKEELKFC